MNVAIDWHGTFDLDVEFHRRLVQLYEAAGHTVYIVTAQDDTTENRLELYGLEFVPFNNAVVIERTGLKAYRHHFTGGARKDWYMQQRGIKVDYWLDNDRGCWGTKE
jgi:hypothetical protein